MEDTEYAKYNLWNLGYGYADRSIIHEKSFSTNLQWMEDFQKISAEAFYRWEYAQDKKVSFRFFGGSPIEEFDGICISRRNIGINNILIYSYLSLVCFNFSFDVNAVLLRRNRNIIQNQ